jgi:aminopeptidase N
LATASFVAFILATAGAAAEPTFSFANTPGRLLKTIVPIRYALELKPDFDHLALSGSEVVDVDVLEPTDRLMLNADKITITSAMLEGAGEASRISHDVATQIVTLSFANQIPAARSRLHLSFNGSMKEHGRGLFAADYGPLQSRKRMIVSNLEPVSARMIFPSWDEPSFKAIFETTVTIPDGYLAVSNMPAAREEMVGTALKRVTFEPTPKMSSYLFVLAAGELERVTAEVDGVTIGIVTRQGMSASGQYALQSTAGLLRYYNDYFGIKYPLPKLDLIAIPGDLGFGGAMENWGGIVYPEGNVLFDPAIDSEDQRWNVFTTVAHETAHQWFGNLVTMAWWDNLWLNEGFANWMEYKATAALNPDWQVRLTGAQQKQIAMRADAGRTAHPVLQPIDNDFEAEASFDTITYSKGGALIRMAESYLGEDVFRAGIRRYMAAHSYSNATSADLWLALEAASGKPIAAVATAFIEQPGMPLVVVEATCNGGDKRMSMRQDRFTIDYPEASAQTWRVPILFGRATGGREPATILLDGTSELAIGRCDEPVKLNLGDTGYYRVAYDPSTLAELGRSLNAMAPLDQVNLIGDAQALLQAGRIEPTDYFELVKYFGPETSPAAMTELVRTFTWMDDRFRNQPGRGDFQAYARGKLQPVLDALGWETAAGDTYDRIVLRATVLHALGDFDDEPVLEEANRRFKEFIKDPGSLPKALRDPVVQLAGRGADRATYDSLIALARSQARVDQSMRYYSAAASALDPALARETLALALTEEVPSGQAGDLVLSVAKEHRDLAWSFVQANFPRLARNQGPQFRNTFLPSLMMNFNDPTRGAELASFLPAYETKGARLGATRAAEQILANAQFVARKLPQLEVFLK